VPHAVLKHKNTLNQMVTLKAYAGFLQNNRVHRDGEDRAARDAGVISKELENHPIKLLD
jgi:hypothetical protein